MRSEASKVLDKITFLYENYSNEHRASTQPFHLEKVKRLVDKYKYKFDDLLIREPLIEHSGSLPIVATTIYPYINDKEVSLGDALIMLAIHDIGELVVHDEITFTKRTENALGEQDAALSLLDPTLHHFYLEMEERSTKTAQFAKAVDKMTPDIVDLLTPVEITIERYKKFVKKEPKEIIETIKKFKHPYMLWNSFMTRLHLEILDRLERKIKKYY
jgi:5'-deoxynucleotidase YfbR-like HD superfamily hydrolase